MQKKYRNLHLKNLKPLRLFSDQISSEKKKIISNKSIYSTQLSQKSFHSRSRLVKESPA